MGVSLLDKHGTPLLSMGAPAPETLTLTCSCEEGMVLANAGEDSERYVDCQACDGSGKTELCRCEICGQYVTEHEIDNANVCTECFNTGLEALKREEEERAAWVAEQLQFGESVGWL